MKTHRPKILVVLGPTATGKSDFAVSLAKKFNGEIISADSRQVYKGMDLGTGKITKKEMAGVPHYLLDVVKPNTKFSVAKYKKLATKAIEKIIAKNKIPIICGGTGFYIDAVVNNIILPDVPPNQKLRNKLEKKTCEELFKILQGLDLARTKTIDKHNKVRLIRAIEIATAIGKVPPCRKTQIYEPLIIGLDLPDSELKRRISARLKRRLDAGMVAEVRHLHQSGVSYRQLEKFGLEYRNCALLLQKKINMEQLIQNLEREIWQYVKRQRTWFKQNKKIIWLDPLKKGKVKDINKLVENFVKK